MQSALKMVHAARAETEARPRRYCEQAQGLRAGARARAGGGAQPGWDETRDELVFFFGALCVWRVCCVCVSPTLSYLPATTAPL